jgi:uncharacterized membrane protein YidH (DUF202 family)
MALATRPKPKPQHRKQRAQHHHHGKLYLKTYWPYLPMLAIIGVGALVNRALYSSSQLNSTAGVVIGTRYATGLGSSSRLHSLLGTQTDVIFLGVLLVTAAAFAFFVASHWYRLHRLMNKGEAFVIRRPWLDIATVAVFTVGFVLTRAVSVPH